VIIGEGKPENQNHATIFAHHEGIQAIDMNQDGYMCEWLKMRNLLTELEPSNQANYKTWCQDDENFVFDSSLTVSANLRMSEPLWKMSLQLWCCCHFLPSVPQECMSGCQHEDFVWYVGNAVHAQ